MLFFGPARPALATEPIPDRVVVLTFDDSVKSHFTVVRPLLIKYGFGATFFITEGFEFSTDKENYMTWQQIVELHRDGFEIGNHTRDHMTLDVGNPPKLKRQLADLRVQVEAINERCREYGIPRTTSFAYPGNGTAPEALSILDELGIRFARRGGAPEYDYASGRGFAYEPGLDHPLLIPSAGDARPDWEFEDFRRAVDQARFGRVAVLQFHGVPDLAHPWVNSRVDRFEEFMRYLLHEDFTVIALRDLARYVDPRVRPHDPNLVVRDRRRVLRTRKGYDNTRRPGDAEDLERWLRNMVVDHQFSLAEVRAATGLRDAELRAAVERFEIVRSQSVSATLQEAPLRVLPYPGGRHPRIGFLDGAIRPQRETKISVFVPWNPAAYVVVDVPEAIRRNDEAQHGLLYLAHTHVDTMWTRQGIELERREWDVRPDGSLVSARSLPNNVAFGATVLPASDAVRMEIWLTNGSHEPLSELRVQNCVMLKGAPEFISDDPDRTVTNDVCIARRSDQEDRWLITAWQSAARTWANSSCPCIHSDPQFPDAAPGDTHRLRGWLSFYEGDDVAGELERIASAPWLNPEKSAESPPDLP